MMPMRAWTFFGRHWALSAFRDAAVAGFVSALVGSSVNLLRPDGIPFIQKTEYAILVPCPEIKGEARGISPKDPRIGDPAFILIDARSREDVTAWRVPNARSIPYDYLEPVSSGVIKDLLGVRAKGIIVYGDGESPDSGRELARELAGKGLRNVFYVEGGAPVLHGSVEK